jgi:hypothetical protein
VRGDDESRYSDPLGKPDLRKFMPANNALYYGDNLAVLRESIKDE